MIWIILISIELLTFLVLKEHYYKSSKPKFYAILTINFLLSIWLWYLAIWVALYRGFFDTPENIWNHMNLTGMICAVVVPRIIISFFHYSGKLIRIKRGDHIKGLTQAGIVISAIIFCIIILGTFVGRFNFKTEKVTVRIKGLDPMLEGLRIVHISDLHLACFHNHPGRLQDAVDEINRLNPDLIINTGDFISYGWREFGRCDTILARAKSNYGNLAVLGNHDMGTYFPNTSEADKDANVAKMKELIAASGYRLLDNENILMNIRGVNVDIVGVETAGRYPGIVHTDIRKAMSGIDSGFLKLLLIHDPNQWKEEVTGKTGITLSFAGHTHGMQIGIITKKIRWSPSKYYYPQWGGLYSEGDQFLYVNRGLGVLAIPFRIWMPPEITLLTLEAY